MDLGHTVEAENKDNEDSHENSLDHNRTLVVPDLEITGGSDQKGEAITVLEEKLNELIQGCTVGSILIELLKQLGLQPRLAQWDPKSQPSSCVFCQWNFSSHTGHNLKWVWAIFMVYIGQSLSHSPQASTQPATGPSSCQLARWTTSVLNRSTQRIRSRGRTSLVRNQSTPI